MMKRGLFFILGLLACGYALAQGGGVSQIPFNISSPSNGECLVIMGPPWIVVNSSCSGSSSTAWANITGGTNTSAAMVVGTGASLTYSGSGSIDASEIVGLTWPSLVSSDCLTNNGSALSWGSCGSGSSAFSSLTSGTNTSAAMVVGTGASISYSGSGSVNASEIVGLAWPSLVSSDCLTNNGSTLSWSSCGSGSGVTLQTNGTNNSSQSTLNIESGSGITATNPSGGNVSIALAAISSYSLIANDTDASAAPTGISTSSTVLADLQASTTFTVAGTGCTPSAHSGGPFAGTVTLASGPCTSITITMNGATGFTAPNGYHCNVGDRTLQAAGTWFGEWSESSSTTTTATLAIPAAAGSTDVISFDCEYF